MPRNWPTLKQMRTFAQTVGATRCRNLGMTESFRQAVPPRPKRENGPARCGAANEQLGRFLEVEVRADGNLVLGIVAVERKAVQVLGFDGDLVSKSHFNTATDEQIVFFRGA